MDIKELQKIFSEKLAETGDIDDAIMATYYLMNLCLLDKYIVEAVHTGTEARYILDKIAYARSRLCLFTALPQDRVPVFDQSVYKDALIMYWIWLESINYCHDNLQILSPERAACPQVVVALIDMKELVAQRVDEYAKQFAETRRIPLLSNDFQAMCLMFDLVQQLILGNETAMGFCNEFNQAVSVIRYYQAKLVMPDLKPPKSQILN